jgi:hypothetical protein
MKGRQAPAALDQGECLVGCEPLLGGNRTEFVGVREQ